MNVSQLTLSLLFFAFLLNSCASTKKVQQVTEPQLIGQNQSPDWLMVTGPDDFSEFNSFETEKSSFVPAILYWGWNSEVNMHFGRAYYERMIATGIAAKAEELGLQEKYPGAKLSVNVENLPENYVYQNKGNVIIFVIAWSMTYGETIVPNIDDIRITYEFSLPEDGSTLTGVHDFSDVIPSMSNRNKTLKNFTAQYIEELESRLSWVGEEIAKSIYTAAK